MKIFLSSLLIIAGLLTAACKKTRTCSCKVNVTYTGVSTLRSTGSTSTTSSSSNLDLNDTYSNITKSEMIRLAGCINRTETASSSYTTSISVPTKTVISGITYNTFIYQPVDVVNTDVYEFTCEIK